MILYKFNDDETEAERYADLPFVGSLDQAMVQATKDGTIHDRGHYALMAGDKPWLYTVLDNEGEYFFAVKGIHRIWRTEHGSVAAGFPEVLPGYAPQEATAV